MLRVCLRRCGGFASQSRWWFLATVGAGREGAYSCLAHASRVGYGLRPARDGSEIARQEYPPPRLHHHGFSWLGTEVRSRRRSSHSVTRRRSIARKANRLVQAACGAQQPLPPTQDFVVRPQTSRRARAPHEWPKQGCRVPSPIDGTWRRLVVVRAEREPRDWFEVPRRTVRPRNRMWSPAGQAGVLQGQYPVASRRCRERMSRSPPRSHFIP